MDLEFVGHHVGAPQPRSHDCPSCRRIADRLLEREVGEQSPTQCPAEGVSGTETVGDRNAESRHLEVNRKVVGWEQLAERHGSSARNGRHESAVDSKLDDPSCTEAAEWIVAGPRDHGSMQPQPGSGHGHIGRASAEQLLEPVDLVEWAALQRVQISADPSHAHKVESGHDPVTVSLALCVGELS